MDPFHPARLGRNMCFLRTKALFTFSLGGRSSWTIQVVIKKLYQRNHFEWRNPEIQRADEGFFFPQKTDKFPFSNFSSIKAQLGSALDFPLTVRTAPHFPSLEPSIPTLVPTHLATGGHPQPLQWEQGFTSPHLCCQDFPPSSNPTSIIFKNNLFLEFHFTVSARLQSVQRFPKQKQMLFYLMDQKNLTPYVPLYLESGYFIFFYLVQWGQTEFPTLKSICLNLNFPVHPRGSNWRQGLWQS